MPHESTEVDKVTMGGGICGPDMQHRPGLHIANLVSNQHQRFWAQKTLGIYGIIAMYQYFSPKLLAFTHELADICAFLTAWIGFFKLELIDHFVVQE